MMLRNQVEIVTASSHIVLALRHIKILNTGFLFLKKKEKVLIL